MKEHLCKLCGTRINCKNKESIKKAINNHLKNNCKKAKKRRINNNDYENLKSRI